MLHKSTYSQGKEIFPRKRKQALAGNEIANSNHEEKEIRALLFEEEEKIELFAFGKQIQIQFDTITEERVLIDE